MATFLKGVMPPAKADRLDTGPLLTLKEMAALAAAPR